MRLTNRIKNKNKKIKNPTWITNLDVIGQQSVIRYSYNKRNEAQSEEKLCLKTNKVSKWWQPCKIILSSSLYWTKSQCAFDDFGVVFESTAKCWRCVYKQLMLRFTVIVEFLTWYVSILGFLRVYLVLGFWYYCCFFSHIHIMNLIRSI